MLNAKAAALAAGGWRLGRRMKQEALIMTSPFTLIFHRITRIIQDRSLYFGDYVGVKRRKPQTNIFRATNGVGFT